MGPVGSGGIRLSQTRPIPRSPDGDKNHPAFQDLDSMAQSLSMFVDGVSNTELLSNNCKGQQWPSQMLMG